MPVIVVAIILNDGEHDDNDDAQKNTPSTAHIVASTQVGQVHLGNWTSAGLWQVIAGDNILSKKSKPYSLCDKSSKWPSWWYGI